MLLLIVKLLLMLLRLGNKYNRCEAILRLDARVRLQAAVLRGIRAGFPRVPTCLGLFAVRTGGALLLIGAAVTDVAGTTVYVIAVAHWTS